MPARSGLGSKPSPKCASSCRTVRGPRSSPCSLMLMIPRPYLYGGIMVFAFLGAYAANGSAADLVLLLVIGLVGYVMRVYDFPIAPVLVGMILGPLAEQQLRRALAISQGDPTIFVTRPIAAGLLVVTLAIVLLPFAVRLARHQKPLT
jgi:putative tricarboxylic transport membrane protein